MKGSNLNDIFNKSRFEVPDNGFHERLMQHIDTLPKQERKPIIIPIQPPSRNTYRIPALIASIAGIVLFVFLFKSGILYDVNYSRLSSKMSNVTKTLEKNTNELCQKLNKNI